MGWLRSGLSILNMRWSGASGCPAIDAERRIFGQTGVSCSYHDTSIPSPEPPRTGVFGRPAARPDVTMHSIEAGERGPHVVCLPGYGAGSAFYYRIVPGLSSHCQLHLVDWLGTGLSARPPFTPRSRSETEAWFVSSLESWREARGLRSMVLVGHSLGGYLSTAYAIAHPERVDHLVLVCPAGVAEKPKDHELPDLVRSPFSLAGIFYRVAHSAWNAGVTPGVIVRTLGPFARRFTRGYAERRMHVRMGLPREDCDLLETYMFETLRRKGSGEFALRHLLKPFAWAHEPMEHRMDGLAVPVTFMYGENDWMDPEGAKRVTKRLAECRSMAPGTTSPSSASGESCNNLQVLMLQGAGHFPFLEKPEKFSDYMLETLQHMLARPVEVEHDKVEHHGSKVDDSASGVTPEAIEAAFTDL